MSDILLSIDFTSADCYLALKPTRELVAELGTQCELVPFRVEQSPPPTITEDSDRAERHQALRVQYRQMNTQRYAKVQGITHLRDDYYHDSTVALYGLALANQISIETGWTYAESVFKDYWAGNLEIESQQAIKSRLQSLALGAASLDLSRAAETLQQQRERLEGQGVFGVPTYLVNGEMYQGRQHLPLIRSILT